MTSTKKLSELMVRLNARSRTSLTTSKRQRWRRRHKYLHIPKTKAQCMVAIAKRRERRESYEEALKAAQQVLTEEAEKLRQKFGTHTTQYYREAIIQHASRCTKSVKRVSEWNAFVHRETERYHTELPEGEVPLPVTKCMAEIRESWSKMKQEHTSEDITMMLTSDVKALEEKRAIRATATRNLPIQAFHDARANMLSIDQQLKDLHARTGTESIYIAVRSSSDHYNSPHFFATSSKGRNFLDMSLGINLVDLASRFEAFVFSGIKGAADHYNDTLQELKKKIGSMILKKLSECAGTKVSKMFYQNFDDHITKNYGVVLEHWPLKQFRSPGDLRTMNELKVLFHAWDTGATRFRKLSSDEFIEWKQSQDTEDTCANPNEGHDLSSMINNSLPPPTEPTPLTSQDLLINSSQISAITDGNGTALHTTKKQRKQRSDKGVKRGPRKTST